MADDNKKEYTAFVLMPFDPEFEGIFNDIIQPALEEVGFIVRRADSIVDQQNIIKDVVRNIEEADLVVADVTALNPNVLYELGIAHGMLKATVILTQVLEEVPFDLRSYRILPYTTHYAKAAELVSKLQNVGVSLKEGTITFGNPVADFATSLQRSSPGLEIVKNGTEGPMVSGELEKEEPGWLDFFAEAENSMGEITEFAEKMTEYTQIFGQKLQARTVEIETVSQSRVPGGAAKMHKIAQGTAFDLIEYAKKTEIALPGFHDSWEKYLKNTTNLFSFMKIEKDEDREQALNLIKTLEEFEKSITETLKKIKDSRGMIDKFKGITRDLNRGAERLGRALDGLIQEFTIGQSYSARIINLLEEKLELEG